MNRAVCTRKTLEGIYDAAESLLFEEAINSTFTVGSPVRGFCRRRAFCRPRMFGCVAVSNCFCVWLSSGGLILREVFPHSVFDYLGTEIIKAKGCNPKIHPVTYFP